MFNVNADMFRAAALFVSSEQTRYYLAGVHIAPHAVAGVTLTATDGHRLLCVHDESGVCDQPEGLIVRADPVAMRKAAKRGRDETEPRRFMSESNDSPAWVTHADGEQVAFFKDWRVDGSFPDWRRVMPSSDETSNAGQWYNPKLIADFVEVSKLLGDDNKPAIRIAAGDEGSPAMVRLANVPHAFGVIMPMRGPDMAGGIPEFVNAQPAAESEVDAAPESIAA